jgi:V/A-type H+-transporting ATPase subunit E
MTEQPTTSGVQELIDRLSQEGVAEGQQQAEKIVSDAQQKADGIVDSARQQANEILKQAREEAEQFQAAGEDALRLAARDSVRDFAAKVHEGLRQRLQELVQHQIKEPKLIKRMILAITRKATEGLGDEQVEILLPSEIITEEEARQRIEAGDPDALTEFIQGVIGEDLREGFTVDLGSQRKGGLTVRVVNQNVEIDLTDDTITALLAKHLLPRYRAIMRKV